MSSNPDVILDDRRSAFLERTARGKFNPQVLRQLLRKQAMAGLGDKRSRDVIDRMMIQDNVDPSSDGAIPPNGEASLNRRHAV